jgi:hypothetical protein
MKLCIDLGLHRKPRRQSRSLQAEMNRRRFWTAYVLDRDISIALGRPPSISDHDIDVDVSAIAAVWLVFFFFDRIWLWSLEGVGLVPG